MQENGKKGERTFILGDKMEQENDSKLFYIYKGIYEVIAGKNAESLKEKELEVEKDSGCLKKKELEFEKDLKEPYLKSRYIAIFVIFLGEIIYFYHQTTMSVNIVAMVNNSALPQEEITSETFSCPVDHIDINNDSLVKAVKVVEGEFQWSPKQQGYILASGFYAILSVPVFSRLAEKYGGKKILFWCLFLMSTFTFISPFAAQWNVYALIVVQNLRGMAQGGILPTESILVANWSPKQERGFLYTFLISGCSIGGFLGSYVSGVLCELTDLGGWKLSFFVSGGLGFFVSALVLFFLYDNPRVHPRISQAELTYITSNQENALVAKRPKTPWKKISTSIPVYALAYAYFGQMWSNAYFVSINPTFLKTILHSTVEQSGRFSSLPFIMICLMGNVSGVFSKLLSSKTQMSISAIRKFWTSISCLGYSGCVLGIYFAECNPDVITTLSVIACGFIGFCNSGVWIICNDMSPTFSASINAIAFTVGNFANFFLPFTVGQLTENSQTLEQWQKVFFICIAVSLSSGLVFAIFGSGEIQPWNYVVDEQQPETISEIKPDDRNQTQIPNGCKKDLETSFNSRY